MAAKPAACGAANEVPVKKSDEVSLLTVGAGTNTPGANTSRTEPKFEDAHLLSELSIAPTVMADDTCAGETLPASMFEFPAPTVKVTPDATALLTAVSIDWQLPV